MHVWYLVLQNIAQLNLNTFLGLSEPEHNMQGRIDKQDASANLSPAIACSSEGA